MDIRISPSRLSGSIAAIPSKSDVHRLLICASLADKETRIICPSLSSDIEATAAALSALGAGISYSNGAFEVDPIKKAAAAPEIDCRESGSTLRFLLPVAATITDGARFSGRGRLPDRPISELIEALSSRGVSFSGTKLPFETKGQFSGGVVRIAGNLSSQYITGLLLALPCTENGGRIELTAPLESSPYVDMTERALDRFGVRCIRSADGWTVSQGQHYASPGEICAEGDWSNAAFFLAAGVEVTGLDPQSPQGDRAILAQLREIKRGGAVISLASTPDSLPILAVTAALSGSATVFTNAARLRLKESDRLKSVRDMLISLGGSAIETEDGLEVIGTGLRGGIVDSQNDHRIAMAAAVAASFAERETVIRGAEAVNKSYPSFWEDYRKLGGKADVV